MFFICAYSIKEHRGYLFGLNNFFGTISTLVLILGGYLTKYWKVFPFLNLDILSFILFLIIIIILFGKLKFWNRH